MRTETLLSSQPGDARSPACELGTTNVAVNRRGTRVVVCTRTGLQCMWAT